MSEASPGRQQEMPEQADQILTDMSEEAAAERGLRILIDAHAIDHAHAPRAVAWAYHRDFAADGQQRVRFPTDACVQAVRHVLDQEQRVKGGATHDAASSSWAFSARARASNSGVFTSIQ